MEGYYPVVRAWMTSAARLSLKEVSQSGNIEPSDEAANLSAQNNFISFRGTNRAEAGKLFPKGLEGSRGMRGVVVSASFEICLEPLPKRARALRESHHCHLIHLYIVAQIVEENLSNGRPLARIPDDSRSKVANLRQEACS